jgi:predicted DNA-binding transcriptional regulator YafY
MSTKLQRWTDLLAALLGHRFAVPFTELAKDVPAYLEDGSVAAGAPSASLKRMFERDKAELLALGVPIVTVGDDGSADSAYQLRAKEFYLPYLAIVAERGIQQPTRVDRYGYHSLDQLAFDADELQAIVEGARRVAQVGDPVLAAEARSAVRKLAFDLPLGATDAPEEDVLVPPRQRADPGTLVSLGDALFRRKRVDFAYHTMGTPAPGTRTVEPYGLFFVSGHWYLAARDVEKDALRNFRVSRIAQLAVNSARAGTPDYAIPASFALRDHARSRQAWELGDGDAFEAVVEFRGTSGAVVAAAALGRVDPGSASVRRFDVRRVDSFARWLLSFGGDAIPLAPATLVTEYATLVERTRTQYA